MDYQKIYQDFYTKYYDKAEFLIKQFLVKKQNKNWTYTYSFNKIKQYLYDYTTKDLLVNNDENLKKLLSIFNDRYSIYSTNQIHEIFTHQLNPAFNKLTESELYQNYSFNRLILEITTLEALNEISRLLSNNSRLFEMMYKLNEFDLFEIRFYKDLDLEDYPDFQRLWSKLYSNNSIASSKEVNNKEYTKEIWFIVGCLIATGEMTILLKKHKSATQVAKFLNIEKSRPYITDSIFLLKTNGNQNVTRNTNIYNDPNKIIKIFNYCTENSKLMTPEFIDIYSKIERN